MERQYTFSFFDYDLNATEQRDASELLLAFDTHSHTPLGGVSVCRRAPLNLVHRNRTLVANIRAPYARAFAASSTCMLHVLCCMLS